MDAALGHVLVRQCPAWLSRCLPRALSLAPLPSQTSRGVSVEVLNACRCHCHFQSVTVRQLTVVRELNVYAHARWMGYTSAFVWGSRRAGDRGIWVIPHASIRSPYQQAETIRPPPSGPVAYTEGVREFNPHWTYLNVIDELWHVKLCLDYVKCPSNNWHYYVPL